MRTCRRTLALLLALLLLGSGALAESPWISIRTDEEAEALPTYAPPAVTVTRSPVLDAALSLLEEGNPFLERYNRFTGADIKPPLPYGVPYFWGGQAPSHVFAKAPDYVVQKAWSSSPIWYDEGVTYIYGFDCVGFVSWVWSQAGQQWLGADTLLADRTCHRLSSSTVEQPPFRYLAEQLELGDTLVIRYPGVHVMIYIGTLRMYGYTEQEVPELAPWLDYPLVIHSTTHAQVARRFRELIRSGLQKYKLASMPDGGVAVSLLGLSPEDTPYHAILEKGEQKEYTWYFILPDGTWLNIFRWQKSIQKYAWIPVKAQ